MEDLNKELKDLRRLRVKAGLEYLHEVAIMKVAEIESIRKIKEKRFNSIVSSIKENLQEVNDG